MSKKKKDLEDLWKPIIMNIYNQGERERESVSSSPEITEVD